MGVYNNNKDGTRSTLANTIQVVDAPMEQFISRGEFSAVTPNDVSADNKLVAENEVTKAVDTMPTASVDLVGTIVQYVGTTTANYTNGYFYKCVSDGAVTPTYSWIEVISGGGSESSRYNVLNHGLKNDGTTDNVGALTSLIDSVEEGAVLYFPAGCYRFTDGIVINKRVAFIGDTTTNMIHSTSNNNKPVTQFIYAGSANKTMFTYNGYFAFIVENITFYGGTSDDSSMSYRLIENTDEFTTLPYSYFKEVVNLENVNCIDISSNGHPDDTIKNCVFYGFSGFGIKIQQHKIISNCVFRFCKVGIEMTYTDAIVTDCHFNNCGICVNTTTSNIANIQISNTWADGIGEHFIKCDNSSQCKLLVNDVWVDMVDKSAICSETAYLTNCQISGRFSRCGMMYAGLADADRTDAIKPLSDVIYAPRIYDSEVDISVEKRNIGSGNNASGYCPSRVISATESFITNCYIHVCDTEYANILGSNASYTEVISKDNHKVEQNIWSYDNSICTFRTNSPIGRASSPRLNALAYDTTAHKLYRATAINDNTAWEEIPLGVITYDTMPSAEVLHGLPNNTIFFTKGFYSTTDKCGGYYLISTSATKGSLMVNYNDKTRYLTAIDVEGTTIDVCRYGVRSSTLLTDLTVENTYATSNSDIIENLYWPYLNCIFKFPSGRFYFARPLKTIGNGVELSIFGDRNSAVIDYDRINNNAFDKGTILAFPFLTNGQTAITLGSGTIKDVTILGDFTTYDITFDRTKTISAPNEVISETIKEVDGTQVKCTGLSHGAIIENVTVAGFYTGINEPNGNIVLTNINIFHCHTGIILHFDNKATNLFGWSVYDFMELHNNCISVTTARVDSCVHMVVTKDYCGTLTLTDIDGDWCTDSMIYLTKDGQYGAVTDSIFDGIHGRCCTLKSYDSTQSDGVDVRDLADTNGYGYVRVDDGITCKNNQFTFNSIGNLASDVTNYLTPAIAITFGNIAPSENIFKTSDTIANILKVFQTSTNYQARIDLSNGTYYINGNSVTKSSVDTTLAKNLVELSAVIDNVSHKVVKNRGEIAYKFSVADVWSNDYTVKSYTGNHSVHKRNGNSLKVVKNDNAKSSFFFVSLNQTLTGTTASTMGVWFYVPRATYDLINYFNIYSGTKNQYGQLTNQETLASIDKTSMNIGWNYFRFNNVTNDFDCLKISIADTNESTSETFDSFDLYFDSIISNYEVVPTVLLAFDNCDDASMYGYCYNEASANGLVGTFAYQGGLTPDNPSNAVTRAHLTEMQESGWDVTQYDGSPMGGDITAIENYNRTLKSEGLDMFCYFPRYNDVTTDIWNSLDEMGFKMVRSANSNPFINAVGIGTYNCYGLTFINNATVVKAKIDTAISDKKLLALIIHVPVDTDDGTSSNCLKTDYEEVISYLGEKQKNNELQVITYKELYYATILSDLNI